MYPETNLNGLVALLQSVSLEENPYQEPEYVPVPLTEVSIQVRVVNFTAQVEVTQKYVNKEKNPIEAIYFFPVEEEAAVVGFTAELEGRTVKTVVKEKQKAEEEFKEAVTNRQTAFLLEETKPDIFQVKVGHLSPGAGCEVTIIYLTELPVEEGKTRITIPTTITPKYIPSNDNSAVAKKIASIEYDFTSPVGMTLKMDTLMKTKIKEITSPSHKIDNKIENTQDQFGFFVSTTVFKGLTSDMDRDIIFLIDTDEPNEPKFVLEKGEDESVVGMLSLVPSFELKDHTADIIFLIDCSGSMGGESINLAKEALQLFLHSLPVDCYFNIFRFGSRFESIFPESKMYDDTTLQQAKQLAHNMDADFGGTEILSPLKHIFSQKLISGRPRQLFVLTDGAVSNSEACITIAKQNSTTARVFTLGIGSGADRHLVKGMARAGKGSAVFATNGELIAPKVLRQLKNSLTPCISNIKVDWGDGSTNNQQLFTTPVMETTKTLLGYGKPVQQEPKKIILETQAPMIVPPVYDGSRLLLYKMYKKEKLPKKVMLTAETPEGNLDLEIPVEANCLEGNSIHQMFARKMIQDLEEGNYDFATNESNREYIVELGTKYGLASKFTSFIGVDEKQGKEVGVMNTRQIKNQITQGYGVLPNAGGSGGCRRKGKCGTQQQMRQGMSPQEMAMMRMQMQQQMRPGEPGMNMPQRPNMMPNGSGEGMMMPNGMTMRPGGPDGQMGMMGGPNGMMQGAMMGGYGGIRNATNYFRRRSSSGEELECATLGGIQPKSATRGGRPPKRKRFFSSEDESISPAYGHVPRPGNAAPKPVSDRQKMLDLSSLQIANGSFKREQAFVDISGKSFNDIDVQADKHGIDKTIWFTALVVALLENKFANDRDSWDMIVDKAKKWIAKSGADPVDVIQKAKHFLQ